MGTPEMSSAERVLAGLPLEAEGFGDRLDTHPRGMSVQGGSEWLGGRPGNLTQEGETAEQTPTNPDQGDTAA